ncbi:MAG: hypothetical protein C4304_04895 [candidate division GAL15 bacterium]
MGAPPDVVALRLEEALQALQEAGLVARVRTTSPPRKVAAGEVQRVVRQRTTAAGEVELLVVWERYVPAHGAAPSRQPGG